MSLPRLLARLEPHWFELGTRSFNPVSTWDPSLLFCSLENQRKSAGGEKIVRIHCVQNFSSRRSFFLCANSTPTPRVLACKLPVQLASCSLCWLSESLGNAHQHPIDYLLPVCKPEAYYLLATFVSSDFRMKVVNHCSGTRNCPLHSTPVHSVLPQQKNI